MRSVGNFETIETLSSRVEEPGSDTVKRSFPVIRGKSEELAALSDGRKSLETKDTLLIVLSKVDV